MEYFNNLNSTLDSFLTQSETAIQYTRFLSIFLVNFISYLYIFVKFYKVLCYSKMTFEWLPMINPYVWPFSIFHVITNPYFAIWAKILPAIKFDKSSMDVSGIVALEALNSLIYFCVRMVNDLIIYLDETEKIFEDNNY